MQGREVGTRPHYWLTLASGMLECLCFAGVVLGFPSLMFVLKEDGYFSQLCASVPGTNGSQASAGERYQRQTGYMICAKHQHAGNFASLMKVAGTKEKHLMLSIPQ